MTLRRRIYLILEPSEKGGVLERIFEIALVAIITLNITAICLESIPEIEAQYSSIFRQFEVFSIAFFSLEYIMRLYSIVENPRYSDPFGRLRYAGTPIAIIDLLSFLPFYLTFVADFRFLRIFRLMSLFRVFKIARYLHALNIFKMVLRDRREQLYLSLFFLLFILVIISFVMYYAENEAQPEKFSSIPAAMWWGVETLTTVGYGDMVPITPWGKFLGGIFALAGVGLLALPAGILSSGFFEMLHKNTGEEKAMAHDKAKCPHCGKDIHG
jgi:voltage-gated potassium channel